MAGFRSAIGSRGTVGSAFSRGVLGGAVLVAGAFVLADVAMVAAFSVRIVGAAAIAIGVFELVHGLTTRTWRRALPRCVMGILYIAFGFAFFTRGDVAMLLLTYVLALSLIVSGGVRLFMGVRVRGGPRWLLWSGLVGLAAGLSILFGWPNSGARWIGLVLGVDLLAHGLALLLPAGGEED